MDNQKRKMETIGLPLVFIITIILSFSLMFYLGHENSIKPFESYMEENHVTVNWNEKDDKLMMKKGNVAFNQIKDFSYIKTIKTTESGVSIELNDTIFNKLYNYIMFGYPLKDELASIKVISNNMDDISITTQEFLTSYYKDFYPYNVTLCGVSNYINIRKSLTSCEKDSRVILNIDSKRKINNIVLDYYQDWDGVASRFMTYNKNGILNKIEEFKTESQKVKENYLDDLNRLKIKEIYPPNIVIINGIHMKTKRPLTSELIIIADNKKEYIEKDLIEENIYINYENKDKFYEDINYIIKAVEDNLGKNKKLEKPKDSKINKIIKETKSVDITNDVLKTSDETIKEKLKIE